MKISELSPEYRQPPPHAGLIADLSKAVSDVESFAASATAPEKLAADLRRILTSLASAASSSSFTEALSVQIWRLGTRLWNAVVDRANSAALAGGPAALAVEAEIRQAAPELLLLAGIPDGVPSAAAKVASFFHRSGLAWLDLGRVDLASACFEKATPLVSAAATEDRGVLLELNLARARAASDAGDQALAVALLSRSKPLAAASPEGAKSLAQGYLSIGEATLAAKHSNPAVEASTLFTEALDLCEKAASPSSSSPRTPPYGGATPKTPNLEGLKRRCLRFLALERLQAQDYEGVLRCIRVSRASMGLEEEHPSIGVMAMRAWIGSGNMAEADKELERLMANALATENLCVSAAEAYLAAAGPEAARKVLIALAARCRAGGAAAAVRVVKQVIDGGGGGIGRARAIAELVSDERVVALFDGPGNTHERGTMHALLWNCGTEHFRAKNYDTSADLIERSMLYVSRDEESRSRRADCFRVLSICHIALQHLDRALEFVNEAYKVEPNIKCAFLKVKINLQKGEEDEAFKQMKTMVGCVDFNPEFLTLTAHEAMSCKSFGVAVASLSYLLGLYSAERPMPMPEVAVLRNLIELLSREPGTEAEILKYSRRAKQRMADLGVESFFGSGIVGGRELNWFADLSWNMGLRASKEKKYNFGAEFFELAAEFFSSSNAECDENRSKVCKALIMAVTIMLNAEELNNSPLSDSDIKKGVEMLSRAGKLLPLISPSVPVASDQLEANNFLYLHTFNSYQLMGRMGTPAHPQQLQLIKNFASSKACTPANLLTLGVTASKGALPNMLAAEFSLKACIATALASQSPNYRVISCALRKLACLAGLQDLNGSKSDAAYDVFQQAYQIVVGLKEGEYPVEEGQWLVATAWNMSCLPLRLHQAKVARKWMKMGLDLARHLEGMKERIASMQTTFENLERVSGDEPDECSQEEAPKASISGSMSQPVLV
uniref:TPR repeat-containing protein ZIP4 n=1 Tax=Oryza glumipatula TaxID=40148 RepID=A0A0D9YIH4_9ORYZ